MSKLAEKKKIEEIAKNFLKKQKSYKNINTMIDINPKKMDNIFSPNNKDKNNEETMKDSLSLARCQNQNNPINKDIKYNNSNYNQNLRNEKENKINDNLKYYSTVNRSLTDYYYCCKKSSEYTNSQIDEENANKNINNNIDNNIKNNKNNNNEINIIKNSENNNNINIINNDDNINNDNKKKSISSINQSQNISDNVIIDENSLDIYNKILLFYKQLMNDFSNNNLIEKKEHFRSQVLSCDFFKFIFEDHFLLFIKYFSSSIDAIKYVFYQIFIFLTIIFLDENKKLNECSEMAYRTILLYSYQNYELLLNIIKKIVNSSDTKVIKSLKSRNKIIISILRTLIPIKISKHSSKSNYNKEQHALPSIEDNNNIYNISYNLLEEIESKSKLIKTDEIKSILYNKLTEFISNLKSNKKLIEKIKEIEKKKEIEKNNINNKEKNNKNKKENREDDDGHFIEEKNEEKKNLILPKMEEGKYRYSLFIELDETLVHYYEEGNNYFVKVRQGTEDFLKFMSDFCEIIIVSTSSKEYTDIIIQNINKDNCYVSYTIYKEMFDDENEVVDFSMINRNLEKCIFICHEPEFFNAPKGNIIQLKEFLGEENDKELVYLQSELMKLNKDNINDISVIIKEILEFIKNKRGNK